MKYLAKLSIIAAVILAALFATTVQINGQETSPSATPVSTNNNATGDAGSTDPTVRTPTPEPDLWHRETMTGDWGGTRTRWKEKGVEFEMKLANFYQGTTSGGVRHDSEYNGKFEGALKLDLGKMSPRLKWWSAEIKAEWRFGGPVLGGTGGINPVNTAALMPGSDGSVGSITTFSFTRLIPKDLKKGDLYAITFGRFNFIDLIDEQFFGGSGTERFFNMAQIGPLTVARQVPLITNGVGFIQIKGGEPRFTFFVLDPNDHSLDAGLDDLFEDGVTLFPGYSIPTKYWGRSAKHSFTAAVTTKKYSPFDTIRQIIIPGPPLNPVTPTRGSWSVSYTFRQYFVERGKNDGWGFFTQIAFADKQRSPITRFFDAGIGGNGLFKGRRKDDFGIAYAFTDLSSELKDNLNLITLGNRRPQPEHQVEMFYNFHITPWLQLTGDLQIIRPVRTTADTAIVPGGRLVMIF